MTSQVRVLVLEPHAWDQITATSRSVPALMMTGMARTSSRGDNSSILCDI